LYHWWAAADQLVPTGTIMIAALTFLIGFQLMLSFLNYDISSSPREPLHPFLIRVPNLAPVTGELAKASAPEASNDGPQTARRQA
jgi:dolichol-phosphate mannosyltransferase